jgi:hypothetical protein
MNYDNLHTTAEILEAFQGCRDAGEEIDLFEALAWRDEPPIDAFEIIIEEIKLEPVLALAIQAVGWVKNLEILENSRQSKKLLKSLCNLASSGATDLIRWSASKSLIAIGFDFISVSQHLTEMPDITAKRIVKFKEKVLIDLEAGHKSGEKITDRNDYEEFINFWVYGSTDDLRFLTSQYSSDNSMSVVSAVVEKQSVYGIKKTNELLWKIENKQYSDSTIKCICDNKLFEQCTHLRSIELLKGENVSDHAFIHAIINQGHSLQSDSYQSRLIASSIIINCDEKRLDLLGSLSSKLLLVARAINICDFNLSEDFFYKEMIYEELEQLVEVVRVAVRLVTRDDVTEYLNKYLNKLSKDFSLLAPGYSWSQIVEIEKIKCRKEKDEELRREQEAKKENDRQAALGVERAEQEAARQAALRAEKAEQEAARQDTLRAEETRARQDALRAEEAEKEVVRRAEEVRRKAVRKKELMVKTFFFLISGVLFVALLYFITICLGAYFNDGKLYHPLLIILGAALLGPVVSVEATIALIILLFGSVSGAIAFTHDTQAMVGIHTVALLSSLPSSYLWFVNRDAAKILFSYLFSGAIFIAFLYPIIICLGAYFNVSDGKTVSPFTVFVASLLLGPIAFFGSLLFGVLLCWNPVFGKLPFDNAVQVNLGMCIIMLIGSLPGTYLSLISYSNRN